MTDPWDALDRELDAWAEARAAATLWWRDDDAAAPVEPLRRLVALAGEAGVPLALAAIPARLDPALGDAIGTARAGVLQHGYAHRNHAPPSQKRVELGDDRPAEAVAADLADGWRRLRAGFGARALPVVVPPWNRIAPAVTGLLPGLGFRGLSTFGPRQAATPAPGLRQINTHVDLIDWRGSRGFVGEAAALAAMCGHLAARRDGRADRDEPTGVLSHHLDHDAGCWRFLETLFARTADRAGARWLGPEAVFALDAGS